jgi:hypothetical protein
MKRLSFQDDMKQDDSMKSQESKSVQFSTIEVRDYWQCLGDHPDVNYGAPVSLDWDYQSEHSYDIEEYEQISGAKEKKDYQQMTFMAFEREYILRKLGYSKEEIQSRSKSVKKDRKKRSQTRRTMIFEPFMIISEETRKWISKRKSFSNGNDTDDTKQRRSSSEDSIATMSTSFETSSNFSRHFSPEKSIRFDQ